MGDVQVMSDRDVVKAITELNRSSTQLGIWNIGLTIAVLFLTAFLAAVQVWSLLKA